ncbi:GIY-YIG nuclease family protein [Patescibacteria group bacterium]
MYFLTNKRRTTLYIGVTNNLRRKVAEHRNKINEGFTKRYNVTRLVYYEEFSSIIKAIKQEKRYKNWHREWKWDLVRKHNPHLVELDPETS